MAAAFGNMAQVYDSQQVAPTHFEASPESQTVPFGYNSQTEAPGEACWPRDAPQEDPAFYWPHQQYDYRGYYGSNYMQYPQQSFPAFQEPSALSGVYPNLHQQQLSAPVQGSYHAPYRQQQCAYPEVPQYQGQYPMFPWPVDDSQKYHSAFSPMMMDSPHPRSWNVIHEPGSIRRGPRRTSGTHDCDFPGCGRVYTTMALLKAHMRLHLDDMIYHCNWEGCGQKFLHSDELARHLSQHFGPYYSHFSFPPH